MLRINELFYTLQMEGLHAGTPAVFIRLQGCPVGCPWCDTKHTWADELPHTEASRQRILDKQSNTSEWAYFSVEQIVEAARKFGAELFVITGGEPCAQDIYDLTAQLQPMGLVQVETSGTFKIDVHANTWVTLSPKVGMRGGLEVLPDALEWACEIKMPVESASDLQNLRHILNRRSFAHVWLQPVSTGKEATDLCVNACKVNGWRLSLQGHKYVGIR